MGAKEVCSLVLLYLNNLFYFSLPKNTSVHNIIGSAQPLKIHCYAIEKWISARFVELRSKRDYGIPLLYATSFMPFTAAQLQFVDNPHRLYRRVSHFIQAWVHESKSYCCIIFSAYICNPMQNKLSSFLTILYLLQGHQEYL